jgi:hypothetical protein
MKAIRNSALVVLASLATPLAFAQTLNAHPGPANNGGSPNWAMFFDLSATSTSLNVISLRTASTAAANANFTVEIFTRAGTALGGPVGSGPGSSSAGWTSLGTAVATQGGTSSGVSLDIDIPDIFVGAGSTTGVAMRFTGAGPRYFGTGSPALSTFTDGTLTLLTGDARSAPFTPTGSFFSSRALVGSVTYAPIPEPASMIALVAGVAGLALRRRKKA